VECEHRRAIQQETKATDCYRRVHRKYKCSDCTRTTEIGEVGRGGAEQMNGYHPTAWRAEPDKQELDKIRLECGVPGVALSIDPANCLSTRRRCVSASGGRWTVNGTGQVSFPVTVATRLS